MFGLSKLEGYLIGVLGLVVALALFGWHERSAQSAADRAADATVLLKAQRAADVQTTALAKKADQASEVAANVQKTLDDYVAAHPVGDVRVCHAPSGGNGVPSTAGPKTGAASANPGPSAVSEVPAGTAGPNIGPSLDALMQAAARLAVLEQERQRKD